MKRSWSNAFSSSSSPGFVHSDQYHSQNNYTDPKEYHSPNNYRSPNHHSSWDDNNMSGQLSHNGSNYVSLSSRISPDDQIRSAYKRNFTPPGFVYFDESPCQNSADTSLSSSPAPPYGQNFSPVNYQIPNNFDGPNSYNSPNVNNGSGQVSLRNRGNYRNRTSYASPNVNNSGERGGKNKWNKGMHSQRNDGKPDISSYYDPTYTLDPWLELEQEYNMRKEALKDNLTNNKDTAVDSVEVDEEMDISESDDSVDSEDDSSSSDSEEETTDDSSISDSEEETT